MKFEWNSGDAQGKRRKIDLLFILVAAIIIYWVSSSYDLVENFYGFSREHENLELDEVLTVSVFGVVALAYFSLRRWQEARINEKKARQRSRELETAFAEIKQLRGILPICSSCKKIRDDNGYWQQVEAYFIKHAEVGFTHGICPECIKKLYPECLDAEEG